MERVERTQYSRSAAHATRLRLYQCQFSPTPDPKQVFHHVVNASSIYLTFHSTTVTLRVSHSFFVTQGRSAVHVHISPTPQEYGLLRVYRRITLPCQSLLRLRPHRGAKCFIVTRRCPIPGALSSNRLGDSKAFPSVGTGFGTSPERCYTPGSFRRIPGFPDPRTRPCSSESYNNSWTFVSTCVAVSLLQPVAEIGVANQRRSCRYELIHAPANCPNMPEHRTWRIAGTT